VADESGFWHPELTASELLSGTASLDPFSEEGLLVQPFPTQASAGMPAAATGNADAGATLFTSLGCSACHPSSGGTGPALEGVFGHEVPLADGSTVLADEAYIHESIVNPNAKIVEGYQPIMPSYANRVDAQQLADLIAYIVSIGGP
jgi:cytochrome c oxidase subunit 2